MTNIEKWTFALLLTLSYTGISVADLGKAMVTPFHLLMGFFIGYGLLVSKKSQNTTFVSLVVLLVYVLFVNILQYPAIRYTSILYTIIYGIELTILYNLMRRCRVKTIVFACEIIIYSYLANLFLGFVFDTINFRNDFVLRYIRVYYHEKIDGGRPMGFSTEPSYATYVIAVAFLCYSHLRNHAMDGATIKLFIKLILCIVFSKSAYGFIFVAVLILDWGIYFYQAGDRLLKNIYPFILSIAIAGVAVVMQTSENESVERISKFSAALFDTTTSGKKKMKKLSDADGSAFARIGPTYMLFNIDDEYEINFWIGEGAGSAGEFLALFLVGILVDEGRTSVDTGIIPAFVFDYGIIGTILLLIFLVNCFKGLSFPFWLLFFLILPNANVNTQLIWYNIACFLFVSIVKARENRLKNGENLPLIES
jgi:hypothetical protein